VARKPSKPVAEAVAEAARAAKAPPTGARRNPLLRELEARKLIEGRWEHPDKRTRRYYSITATGSTEYRRLVEELEPFLNSVIRSVTLIKREIYGARPRG
jgi:hypothetical protein